MATKSATFLYLSGKYHQIKLIEGLEIKPSAARGIVVGTDDENIGTSVYMIGE
jgi:hypothetical protein